MKDKPYKEFNYPCITTTQKNEMTLSRSIRKQLIDIGWGPLNVLCSSQA